MLGSLRFFLLAVATLLGGTLIACVAPLKWITATEGMAFRIASRIAGAWAVVTRVLMKTTRTEFDIQYPDIDPKGTYLVIANHRSWIDILMVTMTLRSQTTLPRFFMKWELIYVPVIGLCAWILDFPIMRRYSAEFLKQHPELKHRDFEYANTVLRRHPEASCVVVNYAEGTRFSDAKRLQNRSPYRHLLKPKVGGPQLTLECLRDRLDGIIDMTIAYPGGDLSVWNLMHNRVPRVVVETQLIALPPALQKTPETRQELKAFRTWMNALWEAKDQRLDALLTDTPAGDRTSP
jgi:1-acyl-sn-glycerol-3-phosphate acyltransferase